MKSNYFRIADFNICIQFQDTTINDMYLLPSFETFKTEKTEGDELLFTICIDDNLQPKKEKILMRKADTGNGITSVYLLPDGGYQYVIRDIYDQPCCLLICNKEFTQCQCALNGSQPMRMFGLNNALMLTFSFAGSFHKTMLIHASCVSHGGYGYPFTAKSGTGKSTHTSLWMKHIEQTELMNDDNPIIRILDDGKPYIYGSPWSGKTACYRNIRLPLGAITHIERDNHNWIERLETVQAFAMLLPAFSSMKWDPIIYNHLCTDIGKLIETTPIYTMHCLPDEEAAHVCQKVLARR